MGPISLMYFFTCFLFFLYSCILLRPTNHKVNNICLVSKLTKLDSWIWIYATSWIWHGLVFHSSFSSILSVSGKIWFFMGWYCISPGDAWESKDSYQEYQEALCGKLFTWKPFALAQANYCVYHVFLACSNFSLYASGIQFLFSCQFLTYFLLCSFSRLC